MLKRLIVAGCMGLGLIFGTPSAYGQIMLPHPNSEENRVTIKIPLLHPISIDKIHEIVERNKSRLLFETTDWEIGKEEVHYAVVVEMNSENPNSCSQLLIIAPGEITDDFQNNLLLKTCAKLLEEKKDDIEFFVRKLQILLTTWEVDK